MNRQQEPTGRTPPPGAMPTSPPAAKSVAGPTQAKGVGFDPSLDLPLIRRPEGQPTFGENHAFWFFDEAGRYYINTHIQSLEAYWPIRHETISICLPDGRILVDMTEGWNTTADTVGGAYLRARCVEPFRLWRVECAGTFVETTQQALADGPLSSERRRLVDWDADIVCPAPPYLTGGGDATNPGAATANRFMGGMRYEQLFRADVRLRVHGEPETRFTATGDRTHRQGPRNVSGFAGHDWKACLFADGTGFNTHRYRTPDDGEAWSEAFVMRDGRVIPAEIVEDTWITSRRLQGETLRVRLASELGETLIEGETLGGTFRAMNAQPDNPYGRLFGVHTGVPGSLALSQSWARYRMDGNTANGLLERSILTDRLR